MSDCLFCKIAAKEAPADIVYEDKQSLVFKDIFPKAEIHLLLIPKRHIDSLFTIEPQDATLMAHLVGLLPKLALDQGLPGGFRTIINTGKEGGQVIDHIHFHLLGGKNLPGFQ